MRRALLVPPRRWLETRSLRAHVCGEVHFMDACLVQFLNLAVEVCFCGLGQGKDCRQEGSYFPLPPCHC